MVKGFEKFLLLMWKNLILLKRHPIQTALEILAPLALISILVIIRSKGLPLQADEIIFTPFDNTLPTSVPSRITIAYSPNSQPITDIVMDAVDAITNRSGITISRIGLKDSTALEGLLTQLINVEEPVPQLYVGVQFDDYLATQDILNPFVNVTIRFPSELSYFSYNYWDTNYLIPSFKPPGPRQSYANQGGDPGYHNQGFLTIQEEVSFSIINYFKIKQHGITFDRSSSPILMQRFPFPSWTDDFFLIILQYALSMFIVISFTYTCISTVKAIAIEKEKQLKETMKIMGLPGWLHWTAWFVTFFFLLVIVILFIILLLSVRWYSDSDYAILTFSDPSIIFFFFLFYISASLTFFFAISVFFKKATTAAILAGVVWYLSYLPYVFLQPSYNSLNLGEKLAASIFSNSAMGLGMQIVLAFESNAEGAQWNNIWTPATAIDTLVLGHVILMLLFDTFLYLIIAIYVEAIFPGEFGVPQVWYFPFTKTYWRGTPVSTEPEDYHETPIRNEFYEDEPINLDAGIKIQHLTKEYSNKTIAVNDLSLNIFKDQITVLLGHNGAGKTTTMSILTGMFPPTRGTAIVGGHDIRKNIDNVRGSLGLCPQHNILFDELTVKEHLYFYSKLKGLNKSEINEEIAKYVELLQLVPKANSPSSTLSGGMKRKLSVGVALCGGSKVVMCDEPSSGMDPAARRALWDLLQSQKKGRTILLTTHFMDEADILGDRIAIMAEGELRCCGTSFFLKKKYGAGYHLTMDKSPECNPNLVTEVLRKYIPDIKVESSIGSELKYLLIDEYSSVFQEMLKDLENQSDKLGIRSYGISLRNLDEVFMKVRADSEFERIKNEGVESNNGYHSVNQDHPDYNHDLPETKLNMGNSFLSGWPLWRNQLLAMFMKKGLTTMRLWYQFVIQNLVAVVLLLSSFLVIQELGLNEALPLLKIELDSYNSPITTFVHSPNNKYVTRYKNFLVNDGKEIVDWGNSDFLTRMLKQTEDNQNLVSTRYLVGATFWQNNTITAWFNNDPYHTPPLALQLAMNSIIQTELTPEHYIQINNHPLPYRQSKEDDTFSSDFTGFNIAVNIGFGMAIASSFYIMFYVRERHSRAKHLQFVSGIGVLPFWLSSFLFDFILYLFTCCLLIIVFALFQAEGYSSAEDLGRIFSILLYFGFSILPLNYLMSFRYEAPATGYVRMVLFNILLGVVAFITIYFFKAFLDDFGIGDVLHVIFLFSPIYSFCTGLNNLNEMHGNIKHCDDLTNYCLNDGETEVACQARVCLESPRCCSIGYYAIPLPGIGLNVILTALAGVLYFLILFGLEFHFFESIGYKICKNRLPVSQPSDVPEDKDVLEEKEKLRTATMYEISKYSLAMRDVTKFYKKNPAVKGISLGVTNNECFGLLGVNGAGKTTTFKMMTGDVKFSYGDAWVNGLSLKSEMKKVHKLIGYCPQFDALLEDLTCWETLVMFSLIRGISLSDSTILAEKLAREFDFYPHLRKRVKQLSGGNKRKLSTAIALIGEPQILYLDEPTTGMDPATKRYLWKVLCKIRDHGTCIILTSHSMEECEALCTRLAIMVNGGFKCLGSTQHLKSKFAQGYTLTIKVSTRTGNEGQESSQLDDIIQFVTNQFQGATLREKHEGLMTFYIPNTSIKWSEMFGIMESAKKTLNIEDYSLGQCTLEQVFLAFSKNQY